MGRKKNLKGLDEADLELINSKMAYGAEDRGESSYTNCSKALNYKIYLKCKNQSQKLLHNLIKSKEVTFCAGAAGTGKSYVALATALELLKDDNAYKKIIIVVPTVQSDLEIGFLKGTIEEKIMPYAQAHIYTMEKILNAAGNNGKEVVKELQKCGLLEIMCVSFLRGLTIDNAVVLIEESQNLPKSAFKTLLTRIGDNSKYIFDGDLDQIDNKDIKKGASDCGLKYAIDKLSDLEDVGSMQFTKDEIVRNPIISKILDRWDGK